MSIATYGKKTHTLINIVNQYDLCMHFLEKISLKKSQYVVIINTFLCNKILIKLIFLLVWVLESNQSYTQPIVGLLSHLILFTSIFISLFISYKHTNITHSLGPTMVLKLCMSKNGLFALELRSCLIYPTNQPLNKQGKFEATHGSKQLYLTKFQRGGGGGGGGLPALSLRPFLKHLRS